jgi:hypothetical protein
MNATWSRVVEKEAGRLRDLHKLIGVATWTVRSTQFTVRRLSTDRYKLTIHSSNVGMRDLMRALSWELNQPEHRNDGKDTVTKIYSKATIATDPRAKAVDGDVVQFLAQDLTLMRSIVTESEGGMIEKLSARPSFWYSVLLPLTAGPIAVTMGNKLLRKESPISLMTDQKQVAFAWATGALPWLLSVLVPFGHYWSVGDTLATAARRKLLPTNDERGDDAVDVIKEAYRTALHTPSLKNVLHLIQQFIALSSLTGPSRIGPLRDLVAKVLDKWWELHHGSLDDFKPSQLEDLRRATVLMVEAGMRGGHAAELERKIAALKFRKRMNETSWRNTIRKVPGAPEWLADNLPAWLASQHSAVPANAKSPHAQQVCYPVKTLANPSMPANVREALNGLQCATNGLSWQVCYERALRAAPSQTEALNEMVRGWSSDELAARTCKTEYTVDAEGHARRTKLPMHALPEGRREKPTERQG